MKENSAPNAELRRRPSPRKDHAPAPGWFREAPAGSSGRGCPRSAGCSHRENDPEGGLLEPPCRAARRRAGADRQVRGQPARSRTPAAARRDALGEPRRLKVGLRGCRPPLRKMRLHCEVEVVSRRLPALGLRNPGKGVRAVLSLCQRAPRSPPRPPAERAGAPRPACLLVSTLKDKRGTRYEVRGVGRGPSPGRPRASPRVPRLERAWGSRARA